MPRDSKPSLEDLTGEAILAGAFDRLRPRLLAMIGRRIGPRLAARVDPEAVVQDAYLRARDRWRAMEARPEDLDVWIYGQVIDRLNELIRSALGPKHDARREVPGRGPAADPMVDALADSHTGPESALSRAERREVVRAALGQLDPTDREILAMRYFDGMSFQQIAAVLGLKENTANTRALRAAVRLRRLLPVAFRPNWSEPP